MISGIPVFIWTVFKASTSNMSAYFETAGSSLTISDITDFPNIVLTRFLYLVDAWNWQFHPVQPAIENNYIIILGYLLFIPLFYSLYKRLRKKELDALWLLIYMAMIILWPAQDIHFLSRFLYPVIPLSIYYIFDSTKFIKSKKLSRLSNIAILLIIMTVSGSAWSQIYHRKTLDVDQELETYTYNREWLMAATQDEAIKNAIIRKNVIDGLSLARQYILPDECVYALQSPLISLYTHRIAFAFAKPETSRPDIARDFFACRSILALPLSDRENNPDFPAYYPAQFLKMDEYDVILLPPNQNPPLMLFLKKNN